MLVDQLMSAVATARFAAVAGCLGVVCAAHGGGPPVCPPPDSCPTPGACTFDGIANIAAGQAQLSITPQGCLGVGNIGSSGQDGVIQDLPPGTTQMTTGIKCPNFAASGPGAKAVFNMFADQLVPDGPVSTFTVENIGGMLKANADFSPVGVGAYVIQTFIGEHMTGNVLTNAGMVFLPVVDLNEIACFWDGPNFVICYKITWVVDIGIPGFGSFQGDIIYVIDPDGPPCVPQTKVENFFANTGPVELAFEYAGPTPPSNKCGPGPGFGPCCQANLTPGCADPTVCACVCAADPFCCFVRWDAMCAGEVTSLGCGSCPAMSDCCFSHPGAGCDDRACQSAVCAIDPFCCNAAWDGICVNEALQLCGTLCSGGGPPDFCGTPFQCVFDGIPNTALGQAQLSITPNGNLLISNIGSSGQDGVVQDLPPGTQEMVTGVVCPNFAFAGPGTQAQFLMLGDVPGDLISEATVVSPDGVNLCLNIDFSPVGVTLYTVQVMIGTTWTFAVKDLPLAQIKFPKLDINEMDCCVEGLHISVKLTCVIGMQIEGVDNPVDGDVIWIIGQNPTVVPQVQTQIVNLFKNTGPMELTFEYAGPASPPLDPCGPAPQVGCCLQANLSPGCDDAECCGQVCSISGFGYCCISVWDQACADVASQVCGGCVPAPGAPANDCVANAVELALAVPQAFDTTNAATDGPPADAGACTPGKDVWYVVHVPDTGKLTISTCAGTFYDSAMSVYFLGNSPVMPPLDPAVIFANPPILCVDDTCGVVPGPSLANILDAQQDDWYVVRLGGFVDDLGNAASGPGVIIATFLYVAYTTGGTSTLFFENPAVGPCNTLTNLGFSSGNLNAANPKRWAAVPFVIGPGPLGGGFNITEIHGYGFTPVGAVNETMVAIVWDRGGFAAPVAGDEVVTVSVPFPIPTEFPDGDPANEDHLMDLSASPINLPPGDYWLTLYANSAAAPNPPANFAWFTNAQAGIPVLNLGGAPFLWRSANFPLPGFVAFMILPPACIAPEPGEDPLAIYNLGFTLCGTPRTFVPPCPGDFNGDGVVDGADLGVLLGSWGPCPGCPADLNGDGVVNGADLGLLLGVWGPCP